MTENLQDCLTCRRKTENFLGIGDESNGESVEAILTKHFWFKAIEYRNRVLCTSCWEKIDEFHKFYCEVEEIWCRKTDCLLETMVKTEQLFDANEVQQELFACELVKEEERPTKGKPQQIVTTGCVESDTESNELDRDAGDDDDDSSDDSLIKEEKENSEVKGEEYTTEDSAEESSIPIGKRRRSTTNPAEPACKKRHVPSQKKTNLERNGLIAKHVQLVCDLCEQECETFSRLLLHYKKAHKIQGYVTCCDRTFQKKSALYDHLRRHEAGTPDYSEPHLRCDLCDSSKAFKDEEGLQLHKVICHSKQEEKIYKCNQCDKAFGSEWLLSGHRNWHQNVESLNIRCDKCNKYFNSIRTLNTHVRAHHADPASNCLVNHANNPVELNPTDSLANNSEHVSLAGNPLTGLPDVQKPSVTSAPPKKALKSADEVAKEDQLIRQFCTLICEKCEYAGENYYQLEKHYKTAHNMRGYAICCGRKFCKKRRLYEHCQRHINPDMFRCEPCNKSFTESDGLEKHNKWVHTPDSEKPFKCEICDAAFYKDYLLRNHMKYHISMEQKIFSCKDCDKSFGTAVLLRAHQQNIHGAASSWVCDICAKGFVHKSLLETHRLSHSAEGAASLKKQCENCKKWLKNKDTYQNHLKRCLAGGPVTCDICGKEAVNELALASHKRFNHEERPGFACSYCGKQFKRILRLKEHEANHRGEVLYSCPYCPRTCNSSSNMYTHKKVAHPELWAAKVAERFYKR
ncbi:transcription factor grauzone-like [Wyeomyia smithii]|uniref:transcription factor grauzone-like n=1 Tax=Wyeomyia smithii TaxID=174621 RepID=UPI002467D294|nr:transcription factor grauzone-like [Wyeomyia smithii]